MGNASKAMTINITDSGRRNKLRLILKYEARKRGISKGQAFKEIIYESIDLESYPKEVTDRLEKLHDKTIERAIEAASTVANSIDSGDQHD